MKLAPPQGQSGWAPSAPEEHGRDIYEAQIRNMQPDQAPPKPWWRKYVCAGQNRDRFRDAVFECTIGDDVSHWLNIWLSPGRSHIYIYLLASDADFFWSATDGCDAPTAPAWCAHHCFWLAAQNTHCRWRKPCSKVICHVSASKFHGTFGHSSRHPSMSSNADNVP
jgi:hypothetical protein